MKKLIYFFLGILCLFGFGQMPQKFSYQAIVRDSNNQLITNRTLGMQVSIIRSGSPVYIERHSPTTNDNGLVTLEIGGGLLVQGDFTQIDWSLGNYFLQTEIDPSGGTAFLITTFTELLSVPYAQFAQIGGFTVKKLHAGELNLSLGFSASIESIQPFKGLIVEWSSDGGRIRIHQYVILNDIIKSNFSTPLDSDKFRFFQSVTDTFGTQLTVGFTVKNNTQIVFRDRNLANDNVRLLNVYGIL